MRYFAFTFQAIHLILNFYQRIIWFTSFPNLNNIIDTHGSVVRDIELD